MAAAAYDKRRESMAAWSSPCRIGDLRRRSELVMLRMLRSGLKDGSMDEALPSRLAELSRGSGTLDDVLLGVPVSSSKLRSRSGGPCMRGKYGLRS